MSSKIWRTNITRNFDIYFGLSWWNLFEKIELRRSFLSEREGLYNPNISFISIVIALLCVKFEFHVNRNNDNFYNEGGD